MTASVRSQPFVSRGAIVLAYQRRLKELHFDPGSVDGVYSPQRPGPGAGKLDRRQDGPR